MSAPACTRSERLRALLDILNAASKVIIEEWEKEENSPPPIGALPSRKAYEAERTIVGACGALSALAQRPDLYLLTICGQFLESRALHVVVRHDIPEILASSEDAKGMHIHEISSKTGISVMKLERIMRTLCSIHVFNEVQEHRYANNAITSKLVGNKGLCSLIGHFETDVYLAAEKLPDVLSHPEKSASTAITQAAFPEYLGRPTAFWEWLEEPVAQPDGSFKPNPSLEQFTNGMVGWGRTTAGPLYQEYPWVELGQATVVDVGGGEGGLCLDLSKLYPHLSFVVQDRAPVVAHANDFWKSEAPDALSRVTFMAHDFFTKNPVVHADVYVLRYIIHDWDDDRSVDILTSIRRSMGANSRVLIADHVINTTLGHPELASAPEPLPADYGSWSRFGHMLDLDMMALINGIERTPSQFRDLASRAGLELVRIWECRGHAQIVEMHLPGTV